MIAPSPQTPTYVFKCVHCIHTVFPAIVLPPFSHDKTNCENISSLFVFFWEENWKKGCFFQLVLLQNFDRCPPPPPLQSETGATARGKQADSILLSLWIWSLPGPLLLYLPLYFHLLAFALRLNMLLLSPGSFLNDQLQLKWDCASDLGYNLCYILRLVHPLRRQRSVCWHEALHPTVTAWARRDPPAPENRQECWIKGHFIAFLLFQM